MLNDLTLLEKRINESEKESKAKTLQESDVELVKKRYNEQKKSVKKNRDPM